MKDRKKKRDMPPKPKDVPKPKAKDEDEKPDAFADLTAEPEPPMAEHVALLSSESASQPANSQQFTKMVEQLQQRYGNAYVQRVLAEVEKSKPDEAPEDEG